MCIVHVKREGLMNYTYSLYLYLHAHKIHNHTLLTSGLSISKVPPKKHFLVPLASSAVGALFPKFCITVAEVSAHRHMESKMIVLENARDIPVWRLRWHVLKKNIHYFNRADFSVCILHGMRCYARTLHKPWQTSRTESKIRKSKSLTLNLFKATRTSIR